MTKCGSLCKIPKQCFEGEAPPVKFKWLKSAGKQMVACFFSKSCHVATIPFKDTKWRKQSAPTDVTNNHCLTKVFQQWCKHYPRHGIQGLLLQQKNARTHTVAATLDCLVENSMNLVSHSLCSPDLAPCDWFLLPFIKQQLRGIQFHFQSPEITQACSGGVTFTIPQSTWPGVRVRWFEKMIKCINAERGFIKKLD